MLIHTKIFSMRLVTGAGATLSFQRCLVVFLYWVSLIDELMSWDGLFMLAVLLFISGELSSAYFRKPCDA